MLETLRADGIEDICLIYKPTGEKFNTTTIAMKACQYYENVENDLQRIMPLGKFNKPAAMKLYNKVVEVMKQYVYLKEDEYNLFALWVFPNVYMGDRLWRDSLHSTVRAPR